MVALAGALWVKTDPGYLVRIDPATNRVTRMIKLDTVSNPTRFCLGLGTDGRSVWACATTDHGTDLAQIDPKTMRIVRQVPVGKIFTQLDLPATSRGVWSLTGDEGKTVSVVDPGSGRVRGYPIATACGQLAAQGEQVVATSEENDTMLVLDAASGATRQQRLSDPGVATLTGGDIWVDTTDGLTRLSPQLATRTVYSGLTATYDGDVTSGAGSVWLRDGDGNITRVDPGTGQLVERITPDKVLSGGSLLIAYGSVWTTPTG